MTNQTNDIPIYLIESYFLLRKWSTISKQSNTIFVITFFTFFYIYIKRLFLLFTLFESKHETKILIVLFVLP